MKLEHKQHGSYELVELRQRHIEAFAEALGSIDDKTKVVIYRRMAVDAAIKAKWFVTPPDGDLKEQDPKFVAWLGDAVLNLFNESITSSPS